MTPSERVAASLTPAQRTALDALKAATWDTATELGVHGAALKALAERGLADVRYTRVQSSNPRARVSSEPVIRRYRITGYGVVVRKSVKRLDGGA